MKRFKPVIAGLLGIFLAGTLVSFQPNRDFKIVKNLDIFYTMFRELNMFYVDETDPEALIESGIEGVLSDLDPYTSYIPPSEKKDFKFQTTGKYGGIGALIRKKDDYAIIAEPYEGFPADKANLKAGDQLLKIDTLSIKGFKLKEISENLKGNPNTDVQVTIYRPYPAPGDTLVKKITRERITIKSVPWYGMMNDSTGYIRFSKFTKDGSKEIEDAFIDLKNQQGAKSIILDLRNNSGGLLNEAIKTCNIFLPKNKLIVKTKGQIENYNQSYRTKSAPIDTTFPLVVMVNGHSASASEIVAGAFQDYDRAVIVGERTFGKGLVQTTRPLSYDAQLKVTTAKYYIPSGRCIQAIDYFHDKDEKDEKLPDSLKTPFKTNNGRTVYEGKGIFPDVHTKAERMSKMAISLHTKNLFFDYANIFAAHHDSIDPVDQYEVSDSTYNSFIKFISDKDFDYKTKSEEKLNELIKTAKREKYYEHAESSFKELKEKLAHDKEKDLLTFKDEIRQLLEEEIVTRYYYQRGNLITSLEKDPQLKAAIEVLGNPNRYGTILEENEEN